MKHTPHSVIIPFPVPSLQMMQNSKQHSLEIFDKYLILPLTLFKDASASTAFEILSFMAASTLDTSLIAT